VNAQPNKQTTFIDLGLIDYAQAWDYQTNLFNQTLAIKAQNRNLPDANQTKTPNTIIFCEHPHVYTLGKSGDANNLLLPVDRLHEINATYYPINRGGDITYHGPGQLVVYPILDLENFFTDIHQYMRLLEEGVILTLREFGIAAGRMEKLTGVWLNAENPAKARKICALGVKMSRWVTMHGLALNINADLNYFNYIIPCGITDKAVTSMQQELGKPVDVSLVSATLLQKLTQVFGFEFQTDVMHEAGGSTPLGVRGPREGLF
jgi:lipoyl(octanoyl) transferase